MRYDKRMNMLKKFVAIVITIIISNHCFAAVISDNDGSALITKAEFDSLKNSFQAQVDYYNQSIDGKIDGAIASYLTGIVINTDDRPEYSVYGMSTGSVEGYKVNTFYLAPLIDGSFINEDDSTKDGTSSGKYYWLGFASDKETQRPGKFGYGYWVTGMKSSAASSCMKDIPLECMGLVVGVLPNNPKGIFYKLTEDWIWDNETWPTTSRKKIDYSNLEKVYNAFLSDAFQQCIKIYKPSFTLYRFWDSGHVQVSLMPVIDGYTYEGGEHGGRTGTKGFPFSTDNQKFWQLCLKNGDTIKQTIPLSDLTFEKMNFIKLDVSAGDVFCVEWKQDLEPSGTWNTWRYSLMSFNNEIAGWKEKER